MDALTPLAREIARKRESILSGAGSSTGSASPLSSNHVQSAQPTPHRDLSQFNFSSASSSSSSLYGDERLPMEPQNYSEEEHERMPKHSVGLERTNASQAVDVSSALTTQSVLSTTNGTITAPSDTVSNLQRELHFAAEIGQYLLEQNQELERSLAECRLEGEWLRSVLSQVDKAALESASSNSGLPSFLKSVETEKSLRHLVLDDAEDNEKTLSQQLLLVREDHALLQRESLLRLRQLQRCQSENDAHKRDIVILTAEISSLREDLRLALLECNHLRSLHSQEMDRVKKITTQPRSGVADIGAIVTPDRDEKTVLSSQLRAAAGETEALRSILSEARNAVDSYETQLEGSLDADAELSTRFVSEDREPESVNDRPTYQDASCDPTSSLSRRVTFSLPISPTEVGRSQDSLSPKDFITDTNQETAAAYARDQPMQVTPPSATLATSPPQQTAEPKTGPRFLSSNTDISTIVRLMVGGWLLKYDKRRWKAERRFVMVNPYTRTISWSKLDPSDEKNTQVSTVYIQSVHIEDLTDGRSRIVISSPTREVVLECGSAAEHVIWERGLTLILKTKFKS